VDWHGRAGRASSGTGDQGDLLRLETKLEHVEERLLVRLGGLMIALFGIAVAWFELRSG